MTFKILAHRSRRSIFGEAQAYLKTNGEELAWTDRGLAEQELERVMITMQGNPNVAYQLVEIAA